MEQQKFGSSDWSPSPEEVAELEPFAALWWQHQLVVDLASARNEDTSDAELAGVLGMSVGNLRKKLRGKLPFSVEEVVRLAIALSPEIIPAAHDVAALFPAPWRRRLIVEGGPGLRRVRLRRVDVAGVPMEPVVTAVAELVSDPLSLHLVDEAAVRSAVVAALRAGGVSPGRIKLGPGPGAVTLTDPARIQIHVAHTRSGRDPLQQVAGVLCALAGSDAEKSDCVTVAALDGDAVSLLEELAGVAVETGAMLPFEPAYATSLGEVLPQRDLWPAMTVEVVALAEAPQCVIALRLVKGHPAAER